MTAHSSTHKIVPASDAISAASLQSAAVTEQDQAHLVSKLKDACFEWVSQVSRMQQLDLAFAMKLAGCRRPVDAATLCGDWMAHRVDSAVAMQHRLLEFWLEANTAAITKKIDHAEHGPA
jgi:hypothetical protein